jgi:hypothetical protein
MTEIIFCKTKNCLTELAETDTGYKCAYCGAEYDKNLKQVWDVWGVDAIQFPRLLDELVAVGVPGLLKEGEWAALEESMGLPRERIMELFGRASKAFDLIKSGALRNVEADAKLSDHDRAEVERCRREVYEEEYKKLKKQVESNPLRLKETGENDFILDEGGVWIEIDNIVVYVRRVEDGVAVDLTPTVSPHETLDCCCADFGMAKEFECTECGNYNNDGEGFNGLCSSCADKAEEEQPCGHPKADIVSSDEGTSYCRMCEQEALVGINKEKEPIEVKHNDLERVSENSGFRSICPVCEKGTLPVKRDPETFALLSEDNCLLCGQRFIYTDMVKEEADGKQAEVPEV